MELEWQQIDLRYESLRRRSGEMERKLLASLAEVGQLLPVVVVGAEKMGLYVLVDGYKRVRAGKKLHWDTLKAMEWELDEAEALLLERMMRTGQTESALEQGWLLRELQDRFGLSQSELARRFDRSQSWVSRRLALVDDLPKALQEQVQSGVLSAHVAMKYLAPMARAMPEDCTRLVEAVRPLRLSSRQVGELYMGWLKGSADVRERVLTDPMLFLRAQKECERPEPAEKSPFRHLVDDFSALAGIARRAKRRLKEGHLSKFTSEERDELSRCVAQARADAGALFGLWQQLQQQQKEAKDAGSGSTYSDPGVEEKGAQDTCHRQSARCLQGGGTQGDQKR
jgi:ParB family chromosome partitioning protein